MDPKLKAILVGRFSVRRVIASIVLIYAVVSLFACCFAERTLMFFPHKPGYSLSKNIVMLTTSGNDRVALKVFGDVASSLVILYSHGNGEDIGDFGSIMPEYVRNGFAVVMYDYPGYGQSSGTPSEDSCYEAVDAVYLYVTGELKVPPKRVIALGRSIGGGPAVELARTREVGALVLESAFVSAYRVVTCYSILPFDKFTNLSKMGEVKCPVLVVHARKDEVVAFWHGERLYEKANGPKDFLWLEAGGHNDFAYLDDPEYWAKLKKLLE